MAAPIYFFPNCDKSQVYPQNKLNRSFLEERGMGDVWSDVAELNTNVVNGGPGGLSGVVAAAQSSDISRRIVVHFKKDKQTWQPVGDGKALWIGIDNSQPPAPEDIARQKTYAGYPVELAGGNEWVVPIVSRHDAICERFNWNKTELPRNLHYDADGALQQTIKPQFKQIVAEANEVAEQFFDDSGDVRPSIDSDMETGITKAMKFLSLNYRFGPNEQSILQPLDTENFGLVLGYAVDLFAAVNVLQSFHQAELENV